MKKLLNYFPKEIETKPNYKFWIILLLINFPLFIIVPFLIFFYTIPTQVIFYKFWYIFIVYVVYFLMYFTHGLIFYGYTTERSAFKWNIVWYQTLLSSLFFALTPFFLYFFGYLILSPNVDVQLWTVYTLLFTIIVYFIFMEYLFGAYQIYMNKLSIELLNSVKMKNLHQIESDLFFSSFFYRWKYEQQENLYTLKTLRTKYYIYDGDDELDLSCFFGINKNDVIFVYSEKTSESKSNSLKLSGFKAIPKKDFIAFIKYLERKLDDENTNIAEFS